MSIKVGCMTQGGSSGWRKDMFFKQYLQRVTGYFKHIYYCLAYLFFFSINVTCIARSITYLGACHNQFVLYRYESLVLKMKCIFMTFSTYKTYHISRNKDRVLDKCPWMIAMPFSCKNCNKRFPLTSVLLSLNKNKCLRLKGKLHTVLIKNLITRPCLLK